MMSAGVSSSKIETASTQASAARTSARSCSGLIGRSGPLLRRTEASELRPTISRSPWRARRLEVADVAGMQEVEDAVREHDAAPGGARLADEALEAGGVEDRPRITRIAITSASS